MSDTLTKDDVRAIIALLQRQQQEFWSGSWKHTQIEDLIKKLRAAMPKGKVPLRSLVS